MHLSSHLIDLCIASSTRGPVVSEDTTSSNCYAFVNIKIDHDQYCITMIISAPIEFCKSIDFSGVRSILESSCGDWNSTPSYEYVRVTIIIHRRIVYLCDFSQLEKGYHLESTTVCQQSMWIVHEFVQSTNGIHYLLARSISQVISIAENHVAVDILQLLHCYALH